MVAIHVVSVNKGFWPLAETFNWETYHSLCAFSAYLNFFKPSPVARVIDLPIMSATKEAIAIEEHPREGSDVQDGEKDDIKADLVPEKFRGTSADKKDMSVLGRKQVLRRNFKFITMLGFASTVMASWEILLPLFTFVLTDGGTALLFWGFIAVVSGLLFVYASLAELASM